MVALLPAPLVQFCDDDGVPYVGGTLATYIPGTTTAKTTWSDAGGAAANTNPVVLDAAGRCTIWGDGQYRLILHDGDGNLIFDGVSSTFVSAAMAPVCLSTTVALARTALGVDAAIAVETARALAAEAALATAQAGFATAANLAAEVARATAAEAAEKARAEAAEAALAATVHAAVWAQGGTGGTDADGHCRVTFATPFNHITSFVAMPNAAGLYTVSVNASFDNTGADVYLGIPATAGAATFGFSWVAMGT